jgi:hypothetical protein
MPSSITLTVSHLPTSTSFFLSALQPLDYAYRGRTGQTIGFGSTLDKTAPADFWITQEAPGFPATAAHVAFNASSRAAVQDFFVAALKAGGKIHGEPCVRDSSGYYSSAVIDFDGNSIEAVYRPSFSDDKENDSKSDISRMSSVKAPSAVARSTVSRAPSALSVAAAPPAQTSTSGGVIDNLFAEVRNAADVARNLIGQVGQHNPQSTQDPSGNNSNGVVIGTLLGVAAGAALHYAFSNNTNGGDNGNAGDQGNNANDAKDVNVDNAGTNSNEQTRPPGAPRSMTDPPPRSEYSSYSQTRQPRAIEAPPSFHPKMITMHENDTSSDQGSTVRPRRSSSVTGYSTASKRTSTRMIEAAPPSSYKAPSALTTISSRHADRRSRSRASSASRHTRGRSQSTGDRTIVRVAETVASAARYALPESIISRATSKRSAREPSPESVVSAARYALPESTVSKSTSRRSARDSSPETTTTAARYPLPESIISKATSRRSVRESSPETITSAALYALPESTVSKATSKRSSRHPSPTRYPLPESTVSKATSKRSSRHASPSRYPLPASTTSKATSKASSARTVIRDQKPEDYPLPASQASTQIGSTTSKHESRSGRSYISSGSKSVISKSQDLRKLDLPKGELTPDDSVSQISVARSSRSRRSRA